MPITREVVLYMDRRIEWFAASGEGKRDNFDEIPNCMKYIVQYRYSIDKICIEVSML